MTNDIEYIIFNHSIKNNFKLCQLLEVDSSSLYASLSPFIIDFSYIRILSHVLKNEKNIL